MKKMRRTEYELFPRKNTAKTPFIFLQQRDLTKK